MGLREGTYPTLWVGMHRCQYHSHAERGNEDTGPEDNEVGSNSKGRGGARRNPSAPRPLGAFRT